MKRPNVLFLFTDQHNASVLGSAGNPMVATPSLDRLSSESVVFQQAYCQNPLCVPSRTSLMNGQYCRTHAIYENQDVMEPNSPTFPRTLAAAGYRTCLIGKAHFNGEQFHGYQQRPYGDFYGQAHQPDPRRTPTSGESGLGGLVGNAGPTGIPLPMTQTEICVAETTKWLQAHLDLHATQPFCLSVHFDKPHFPVRCPDRFFQRYAGRLNPPDVPEGYGISAVPFVRQAMKTFGGKRPEEASRYLAAYYGCVEWIDDAIGRILEVIDYLELRENTVVIYTSDHGDLLGEKDAWNKTLFFESASRIPLLIRWPSQLTPRTSTDLVGLIDLFPTLCEFAGVDAPGSCEGISLLPALKGQPLQRDHIFCESAFLGRPSLAGCMLRSGQWKYNYYLDGTAELYDLEKDPEEWSNLAGHHEVARIEQDLRARVIDFWQPGKYLERMRRTPKVHRHKHCCEFSNQFMLGSGTVCNGRP